MLRLGLTLSFRVALVRQSRRIRFSVPASSVVDISLGVQTCSGVRIPAVLVSTKINILQTSMPVHRTIVEHVVNQSFVGIVPVVAQEKVLSRCHPSISDVIFFKKEKANCTWRSPSPDNPHLFYISSCHVVALAELANHMTSFHLQVATISSISPPGDDATRP
jgi:hypothetical protein